MTDLLAPPTRFQREVVTLLHYFEGTSSRGLARGLARSEAVVMSALGVLLEDRYIERDGLGGYRSTGRWTPEGDREPTALDYDSSMELLREVAGRPARDHEPIADNVIDFPALLRETLR